MGLILRIQCVQNLIANLPISNNLNSNYRVVIVYGIAIVDDWAGSLSHFLGDLLWTISKTADRYLLISIRVPVEQIRR